MDANGKEANWRRRGVIRELLGLSVRENDISGMRMHALALMKSGKYKTNEVAKYAGFSSVQKMQESLNQLSPTLPEACQ
ncbi:MAG: hypothetical protein V1913_18500 [Fibrobacterota bacterium]